MRGFLYKTGFNRYMVECEFSKPARYYTFDIVLIDTWWNVNSECFASYSGTVGFNRYMVECECRGFLKEKYLALSFNRYMVECEFVCQMFDTQGDIRFNRYMVECELRDKLKR